MTKQQYEELRRQEQEVEMAQNIRAVFPFVSNDLIQTFIDKAASGETITVRSCRFDGDESVVPVLEEQIDICVQEEDYETAANMKLILDDYLK